MRDWEVFAGRDPESVKTDSLITMTVGRPTGRVNILYGTDTVGRDMGVALGVFAASKLLMDAMVSECNNAPTFSYADAVIGAMRIMVAMATGLVLANTVVYWYMSHG